MTAKYGYFKNIHMNCIYSSYSRYIQVVWHDWQVIQRQLEEVEEKQRALEEKGVALEKVLRGETGMAYSNTVTHYYIWKYII